MPRILPFALNWKILDGNGRNDQRCVMRGMPPDRADVAGGM